MPPTIYLLDGHALAYRTYFALTRGAGSEFSTSRGEPTAGIFGFTSVLLRILESENPDYLAVAFDTGKTFRDELFQAYKATRAKMPEDLGPQIARVQQMVDAFNIPRVEMDGYEADDLLGSLACWAVNQGLGVKIITGDRDLLQLVSERIVVSLPGKTLADARDYFPEDVVASLGVRPDQVVDFKALVGDKSDNIPGVPGIGEKTAVSLLNQFSHLDDIYAHLAELPEALRRKLEEGRESAYLSRQLATIVTNLDVHLDLEQARPDRFDPKRVEALFRELEFRSLMRRLTALEQKYGMQIAPSGTQLTMFTSPGFGKSASPKQPQIHSQSETRALRVHIVSTAQELESLVRRLNEAVMISIDTETSSTDQMVAELIGISLAITPGEAYYLPIGHRAQGITQLPISNVLDALAPPLSNAGIRKVGHNLKYDYVVLTRHGLNLSPLSFDTMIAEWLINPTSRNLGLKSLAWVRKGFKMTEIEELIGRGKHQGSIADVPVEEVAAYAAADAEVVLQLLPELRQELEARAVLRLFEELEMPLVSILGEMELAGVGLDVPFLRTMSTELEARLASIEKEIYSEAGFSFNINSPQQLSEALFGRLKIPPPGNAHRTSSGFYSTAVGVLDELKGAHKVVNLILEYRELAKLKSTYLDALPQQVNPRTGRVHTSFNQTGSVTGRLASSNPNLQNIPIRTDLGRQVRRAFVASPGNMLLSVDYSQIELRIVAHMANDEAMLAAFRAGQDIHATTAAAIFDVPLAQVTKEQRRRAKAINFGLIYGMSAYGLMRSADLTLAEAENFMRAYFARFPGVRRYLDEVRRQASEQGYVETLLGRRRYFPELKTRTNQSLRNREEREAINAPIQGTAADIIKVAMLRIPESLRASGLSAKMLLQVHDELVFECPQGELAPTARLVRDVMEAAYTLRAPLKAEARFGPNWDEMTPFEE